MMRRREALGMLAAAPAVLKGARRPAGDKPNLLFIWTDQQRADTMAAYGNTRYRVPVMNKLASESVVFDRAYVAQPVCTPSRSCVMTGLWPHQNGCVRNNIPLRKDVKSAAEQLGDSDYRTGYFGKWHLGDEIFAQRGFEEWAAIEDGIYRDYYSEGRDTSKRSGYHYFLERLGYKPDSKDGTFSRRFATKLPVEHSKPSFLANEATRFITKHRNEPWMLYVNFLEPHTPFSSALDDLLTAEEAGLPANYPGPIEGGEPVWYQKRREGFRRKGVEGMPLNNREAWVRINRNYAGLCSLVDQAVGRILWSLEASGAMENTLVVYTSDHGEMMGSHELVTKQVMYEEAMRVPYLIRAPYRKQQPMRVKTPVSHVDILPTVLDLLGKKPAESLSGASNVPLLEGTPRGDGYVFSEWTGDGKEDGPNARTVISPDGWKLVLHDTDTHMLFDRTHDPLEMRNLYGRTETGPVIARMRKKLDGWQARTGDGLRLS
ncbi:MAG: sulfatase-like hydrolase/transferase [Acidobacteriota bacterium]